MITKIRLIDETDLIERLGEFDVNIDPKKYKNSVIIAQDKYVREILGDKLYFDILEKFDNGTLNSNEEVLVEFLKQVIIGRVASRSLKFIHNQITNKGVMNRNADFSITANPQSLYSLINEYSSDADYYTNRITNFLKNNKEDFPLFEEKSEDINPSENKNDFGIWGF